MNSFFAPKSSSSKETVKTERKELRPWVEKYRPKKVDELVFQSEVVSVLQKVVDGADLPNMLLYGPPGTGKTSAALALCRELFKTNETYRDRVLELNASDERGIQVVRTRIKDFAHRAIAPSSIGGHIAALKVVILDEADAMTSAAQAALRRTMEKYSKNTRFFLICNYISRIIDPLTSRCAKFRFKPLPVECQVDRLAGICESEGVEAEREALTSLVQQSEGDMRKSVTTLQALVATSKKLSTVDLTDMSGRIADDEVSMYLESVSSGSDAKLLAGVERIRREGLSVSQLFTQLYDKLVDSQVFSDVHKAHLFEKMAKAEYRMQDGGNEELQLLNMSYTLHRHYSLITA